MQSGDLFDMETENEKLLIVDDSEGMRDLLRDGLTEHGYVCLEASDGEQALRLAEEEKPDLIILDMMMPRMDGLEVALRLRRMPDFKDTPIIMLTSRWSVRDKMAGYQCGVNRYLTKPMDITSLLEEIRLVLHRHTKPREKCLPGKGEER